MQDDFLLLSRKDYEDFIQDFSKQLEGFSDICFYIYGSMLRNDFVPGRSDIDGGLIADCNVVTPKDRVLRLSECLADCLDKYPVETQFNLTDRVTNAEGRFLDYPESYTRFFTDGAKIISGPDFVSGMNGLNFKNSELEAAAFGMRKARNFLLMSMHYRRQRPDLLRDYAKKTLDTLAGLPKKLINLKRGKLIVNRDDALVALKDLLPGYDQSTLREVLEKRKSANSFLEACGDFDFCVDSVSAIEDMIKNYMVEFPEISENEIR